MKNYGLSKRILVTNGTEVVETKPSDSSELSAKAERECLTNVELELLAQVIYSRDVVFDIGANVGIWTKEVLNKHPNIQVHLFEPVPESYQKLLQNLAEPIETGQVIANNCAVSEKEGDRAFYYYRDKPSWSTFYRRLEVEKQFNLESPESLPVSTVTLDSYCEKMKVRHIHFLKIDTEGGEFEVIKGAKELLRKGRISYLQFEYGGTFLDAGVTLQEVFEYLKLMRYETFKMSPDGLKHIESFSPTYEDYEYSNFLAVDERFKSKVLGQPPTMLDLQDLCNRYNIVPRGIIHIGAHEGKESERYQTMGVQKVLFIEANPAVYKRLVANISTLPNVDAVNCAISNYDGTTTLHVTSMDQSSSVLPLKRHLEIYPDIKEVNQITVDCRTLDSLLKELGMSTSDFNIINIDIQGAELMAFQGSTDTLKYIDAINTEVNYEELYEGCALIDQIDEFLESYGFERKATTSPYHRSWGDGFYVKTQINSDKPVITMSTLGKNGRFANQLFQYAFLKIYAKKHNLEVRTPPWIGQYLFGHKDPPISGKLPEVKETTNELANAIIPNAKRKFENVDFWGYFQYNTSYYAPYKEYFRSLFKPVPEIEKQMNGAVNHLRSKGKTVVGLHLRRGDYGRGCFFVAPSKWYKDWLQDLWCKLDEPVLFIASDEPEKVLDDFAQYNPTTTKDLDADLPKAPFYPDFYILGKCDIVAISNSSFSFLACMLNEQGKLFCRPRLSAEALIPFDPWNSETIFRDEKVCEESFSAQQTKGSEFLAQGIEKLRSGHPERALSYFNEALVAFPKLPNLHYALAAAYAELGDIFSSKKACEIELSLQPDNSGARRLLERIENSIAEYNQIVSAEKMPTKGSTVGSEMANAISNITSIEPRFSFVMIVLNGMPLIEYALKSIYDFAHEIIIVEGTVEKCMFAANPDGSSTDGTVEFIKSFPDTQNKIILIQGKWPEKCEMQNEALKYVTGDYVWLIDSDEVYKREDLEKTKEILKADPSITQVNFIPDNFWKGLDHIFISSEFFKQWCHYRRLFKYVPGAVFTSHRPPTMVWPDSDKTTEQMRLVDGHKTRKMGIVPFHYSYVLNEQVKQKIELYNRYNWGDKWGIDLLEWYNECFLKWTPENREQIEARYPVWTGDGNSRTQLFTGTHPEVMKNFKNKLVQKHCCSEEQALQVIGDTYYQKKVVEAWNLIEMDEPIIKRKNLMTQNIQQNKPFWNIHVALAFLADRLNPENYLEVGVRTGCSLVLLLHNSDVKEVVAIDMWKENYAGFSNTKEYTVEQINKYKAKTNKQAKIEFIKDDSHKKLKDLIGSGRKFDLITVDGDHSESGAWEDLQDATKLLADKGAIVFDDIIHPSHSYLRKLVDRFQQEHSEYTVFINSKQDNGCAIFLKNIDPTKLLNEKPSEVPAKVTKGVKVAADYVQTGIKVGAESSFGAKIQDLFSKIRPKKIIETGTYLGTGTTTIITKSLQTLGIDDAMFFTIEVNPQNYARAKQYFETNNMKVNALNGLSVPRAMLPSREEIARKTITDADYDGIFADHKEENRAELYYNETNFPNLPDNLLYKCLKVFDFKPDFVLLDSGGHMGNIEFNHLIDNLQGECYIALDDIYHVKHHRSFQQIQEDERFELIVHSKEKFGFCIAKFTPKQVAQKIVDDSQIIISANATKKKQVLIVRTDSIGDFVIFSGALPYYRKLYPSSHISIVVRECSTELADACPYIDEVIVNHRKSMVYDQDYAADFINRIRATKFDVVICPIYSRDKVSDFIVINSGAEEKIVSTGNDSNMPLEQIQANNPYFTKLVPAKAGTMPEVERNKEFLKGLGVIIEQPYKTTVWMEQEHKDFADRLLKELNIEKPLVICPFAQYQIRDWPDYKWAQLISRWRDYPVLICGSQQNTQSAENIIKATEHPRVHNLCGKTSLRQLAALLYRAKLCVGLESAPAHIAAAVDCPHVVIIGGGHFGRFMPYSSKTSLVYNQMDCYGCNWRCKYGQDLRCIKAITVDMVEQAVSGLFKRAVGPSTQNLKTDYKQAEKKQYLVSAIISTYNSEKFIRGCLNDLERQTIADQLEIIVVNSGSQENEEAIVREFQQKYDNIKYIRTEERETIYKAWNRAIKAASGKYITNANTDDRHRQNALEIMARALDENPDKALVYANQLEVNEIAGRRVTVGKRINGQFSRSRLFDGECPPGSQPMWRRDVHEVFGYFDESFSVGGDYEFWFRLTQKFDFLYLNEILGERYVGPETVSTSNTNLTSNLENMVIHKSYQYAMQEAITIGATGISEHPVFSNWPEVNIWKQNTKAKLEDRRMSLVDNIKDSWDFRTSLSPKLTIVIVTYNRHKELLENLYALNDQKEKDFEVIVIDNGGDLSWLKQHIDEFNFGLCGIELELNFGPSPAKNIGTEFAKAKYIAFLDDDAVADNDLVRNIVNHFENYRICGLRGKVLPKSQTNSEDVPANYDLGDQIITTACEVSCLSAFRKDVLVKMGGLDELLFGSEGMELSYRICKAQEKKVKSILYFPDIIVYHDPRPKGPAQTEKMLRQHWMELLAWRKDQDIKGYKELVYSLYPGNKAIFEENCKNYKWLINVTPYLQKNFPEEAIKWAKKAVALRPDGIKGCYILGSAYTWLGRYDEALALLERIYEPLRNSVISGGSEFISSEFEEQVDISECYVSVCTQLAQCYMETNQYDKVKQVYTDLLNNPNLTIPEERKTDILNILIKLDRTPPTPVAAKKKNNTVVPVKPEQDYLISAIVSTYNSEKFLRGCLDDLENQTIAEKLEIVVVNSGSQENEEAIVREYQQKYNNIVYIKTEQREGIYTAWNRAVKVAQGTFLTNANTDDRHREDALEIMAETLLANPDAALVYGDQICTDTPNGTFANHHAIEMARRAEYSHERLLFGCCVGSQPMWRKSLHNELGYFDDTLTCAGDWDFWLRISISSRYKFKHIPEFLGLYFHNEDGIEHGKKIHSLYERYKVGRRYGNPYISVIPLYHNESNPLVSVIMPAYNAAEHIAEAIESVLIQNYRNFELIVIDDGSTDNTKDIVASFKDDKIKYFYKDNGGPSGARNLAIKKAEGQYIMPLDADDMMTPDFIAKHLAEFEKHPDVDLVYCDVLLIGKNSNPIRIMSKPEYQDRRYLIRDLLRAGHPVVPFRLGIRRSVFDRIGFYDEDLLIGEDYDMMRRFVKAGLKAHHLSETLHLRRMHADSLSGNCSAQKAKCHFDVIKRYIDTFAYNELFPDVAWDEIAPQMRQLHAKYLVAGTYLTIGQNYVRTKAIECSRIAFDRACSELNDCVKMDPKNQGLRQLLQKSKLIRAKYTEAPQQVVS